MKLPSYPFSSLFRFLFNRFLQKLGHVIVKSCLLMKMMLRKTVMMATKSVLGGVAVVRVVAAHGDGGTTAVQLEIHGVGISKTVLITVVQLLHLRQRLQTEMKDGVGVYIV